METPNMTTETSPEVASPATVGSTANDSPIGFTEEQIRRIENLPLDLAITVITCSRAAFLQGTPVKVLLAKTDRLLDVLEQPT